MANIKKIFNKIKKTSFHPLFIILGIYFVINNNLLFFANYLIVILLHEFSHYIVAENNGYKLNQISLMPYGARLDLNQNISSSSDELKIIIIGPLVNLICIILCILFWWIFPISYGITHLFYEANLYMLIFNLLPIYPLDGGRIIKLLLQKKFDNKKIKTLFKIINLIFCFMFFILFILSLKNTINFNLLIVSIFILYTVFDEDNNFCYQKINYLYLKIPATNKLLKERYYIVNSKVSLFYLIKNLNTNYYTNYKIIFNDKSVYTIDQNKLLEYSTKLDLYTSLENLKKYL